MVHASELYDGTRVVGVFGVFDHKIRCVLCLVGLNTENVLQVHAEGGCASPAWHGVVPGGTEELLRSNVRAAWLLLRQYQSMAMNIGACVGPHPRRSEPQCMWRGVSKGGAHRTGDVAGPAASQGSHPTGGHCSCTGT